MDEKITPHDLDAEESVLGSLLIDGEAIHRVVDVLKTEDFYRDKNRWVWDACMAVHKQNKPINQIVVAHELSQRDRLEVIGGPTYLSNLVNNTVTPAGCQYYAAVVLKCSKARALIALGQNISDLGYTTPEIDLGASQALSLALKFNQSSDGRGQLQPISSCTGEAWESTMAVLNGERLMPGLPTGFKRLDRAIGGWERGVFYVIAGRPGVGKSHIMLCSSLAGTIDAPAAIFSLEMSKPQIISRLAYMLAGLNKDDIEQGIFDNRWTLEERAEIQEKTTKAIAEVHDLPIWIDDKAGLTTANITARIERMKAEHDLGAVFIDHLGKIGDSAKSLYEKTTLVSGRLAQMAKDCDVPIIALCQLNREAEGKERKSDRRPRLSDLRESGAIEQDARVVLGLYRDDYYSEADETFSPIFPDVQNLMQVMVLKANERRAGRMIPLELDPKSRRLRDWPHYREEELKRG